MILGLYILFKRAYSIQGSVFLLFSVSLTLCLSVSVSVCLSLSLALCEGSIGGLGFVSECWRKGERNNLWMEWYLSAHNGWPSDVFFRLKTLRLSCTAFDSVCHDPAPLWEPRRRCRPSFRRQTKWKPSARKSPVQLRYGKREKEIFLSSQDNVLIMLLMELC